jgi:hypothetical protein
MRLSDLENADEELHGLLEYILTNKPEELHVTFVALIENCRVVTTIDLVENGRNVEITIKNRQEYSNLMVEYHLIAHVKEQICHFCQGFHKLISPRSCCDLHSMN